MLQRVAHRLENPISATTGSPSASANSTSKCLANPEHALLFAQRPVNVDMGLVPDGNPARSLIDRHRFQTFCTINIEGLDDFLCISEDDKSIAADVCLCKKTH